MTETEARENLDRFEANLFRDLYRSRWDPDYATGIVSPLRQCLGSNEVPTLVRTLSALHRIGPEAFGATPETLRLLHHEEPKVREMAVWALGGICYRQPEAAIPHLVELATDELLLKPVMFSLIGFGKSARNSISLFKQAFESPDHRLRRLAIRGLKEIGADFVDVEEIIRRGLSDRSKDVRLSVEKLLRSRWPDRYDELTTNNL